MEWVSLSCFRDLFTNENNTGYPDTFTYYDDKFYLWQIPNGTHTVRLDYIQDIGTPINSYDPDTDAWSTTVGGVAITNSYTNSWFTLGLELVVAGAKYRWYAKYDRNKEEAQLAYGEAREELRALEYDSRKGKLPPRTKPYI
jgi:hypothetical protein